MQQLEARPWLFARRSDSSPPRRRSPFVPGAAREGLPFLLASLAAGSLLAGPAPRLSRAASLLGLACAAFFRDPERRTPGDEKVSYSAADGRVLAVEQVDEPWWLGGAADRVSVFLSPLDVHVNRCPERARFAALRKIPGSFAPAYGHAENNCRDLLAFEGAHGRFLVAQISGVAARRSVQWHQPGEELTAGQRFGMIRFGSRTDVYWPAGRVAILVRPGDRVRAGITPLARYAS